MSDLLREIQAADLLGYQEMKDFRAALKAKQVPQPTRELGVGSRKVRAWSRRMLLDWIDNRDDAERQSMDDEIKELA